MIYTIQHRTRFYYRHWVGFSHNIVRLKPRNTDGQQLIDFNLEVSPNAAEIVEYSDFFGNRLHHLLVREPHLELSVTAHSRVRLDLKSIAIQEEQKNAVQALTYRQVVEKMGRLDSQTLGAKQYVFKSSLLKRYPLAIHDYACISIHDDRSLYDGIEELMKRIYEDFSFVSGFSDVNTPVETVFAEKKGVCQDFAHFMITALRSLGLAARYMSGYIETIPPEGAEKLFGTDASHAWVAVYFPDFGWFEFDPTNNQTPAEQHIVLGFGRDYSDISPMQGVVVGSGKSQLDVMVDVKREEKILL